MIRTKSKKASASFDKKIDNALSHIYSTLGLGGKKQFNSSRKVRPKAMRRTAFAVFVLFGNLEGKTQTRATTEGEDSASIDAFLRKVPKGRRALGFATAVEMKKFRESFLTIRRLVNNPKLSDEQRGYLASKLVGPVVEKLVFYHPDFQSAMDDLASTSVGCINDVINRGGPLFDGSSKPFIASKGLKFSNDRTFLATDARLELPNGESKLYTDFLYISFATSPGPFVLKDNLPQFVAVFNESKAPSVVSESNYQHAEAIPRLSEAVAVTYSINGKKFSARPADFVVSPLALNQVTTSLRGRFGGRKVVDPAADASDWLDSIKYHVPKDDSSVQLRIILSVRREALLKLLR